VEVNLDTKSEFHANFKDVLSGVLILAKKCSKSNFVLIVRNWLPRVFLEVF